MSHLQKIKVNPLLLRGIEEEELGNYNVSDGPLKPRTESVCEAFYRLPIIQVERNTSNPLRFRKHEAEYGRHLLLALIAKKVCGIAAT